MAKGEVEKWVTVNGKHVPIMKDGTLGVKKGAQNKKDISPVAIERKIAKRLKEENNPEADKDAYGYI